MEKGRAYRRAQAARLKAKRRRYRNAARGERDVGLLLHTATRCSCWMCGNPRRYWGERTIQEIRQSQPGLYES